MKFVCDRCLTKYSIADDKVRGRILKIRCKSCSNIITVKESAPSPISVAEGESDRTVITSGPRPSRPSPESDSAPAHPRTRTEMGRPTRPPTPSGAVPAGDEIQWFLALEGVQKGPFSRKVLVDRLAALPKNSDVHVWNDTLDGWRPPSDVPVIARELQGRQRHAPTPPPPPPGRLRPVPPAPIHTTHHAPGRTHPVPHPAPHAAPAMSAGPLGLGVAVAAPALPVDSAALFDTPAPIRELVQAHKAQNGTEAHASGPAIAAAPSALSSNGESDAIQALNLGGAWRQPGAPLTATEGGFSSAGVARAPSARQKNRNFKLATGFIALVGICVVVFMVALKKPPAPAPATPAVVVRVEPPPAPKAPEVPKEVKPAIGPPAEGAGDPEAAGNGAGKVETVARVAGGKKAVRPAPVRNPSPHGGTGAAAAVVLTPEQRAEANRYGDTSSRAIQVRNPTASIAKVTPAQTDITRVVNNNKGGIKVCYQRALLRDNSLTHGKIDVRVSIGISGRVKSVGIDGPASFRTLDPCIKDVLSRWVFPASSEEYGTEFSYLFAGNE
jgi:predicted Zn finger-like uncharacterized protein